MCNECEGIPYNQRNWVCRKRCCPRQGLGYASFKSCGFCAARGSAVLTTIAKSVIARGSLGTIAPTTAAGNGYSGGAIGNTYIGYGNYRMCSSGGGSFYQHPNSTVVLAEVSNSGDGSITITNV